MTYDSRNQYQGGRSGGYSGTQNPSRSSDRPLFAAPIAEEVKSIIVDGNPETTVKSADRIGRELKSRGLTTSQIRNIFGTARRIEMNWPETADEETAKRAWRQTLLLKPKLAYYAKKESGDSVACLEQTLRPAIDLISGDRVRFGYFLDYFEAILAYHKFYGGK